MKASILLSFLLLISPVFGQTEDRISGPYNFTGRVTDVSGLPMAGINLYFKKGESTSTFRTEIDGKFKIGLQPGNYEINVNRTNSRTFHAFVSIIAGGPNPSDVTYVLDPDDACCRLADGSPYPKPISLPKPPYPPAARAVRASGEIEIAITVEPDGSVSDAKAINGHPLLRAAAVKAARSATFEPIAAERKRDIVLTFAFLPDYDSEKAPPRYKNIYRIEIVGAPLAVDN